MADLISAASPAKRAKELAELGIDYINIHVGIDQQMIGEDPLTALKSLK